MDLGTTPRTTASLLSRLGTGVEARNQLLVEEWAGIVTWAGDHIVDSPEGAATITEGYLDTGVPIAGDGAPLVSEFALMELIAVLGRTPDGGRAYVGRVIECAWRLPHVYAAVVAGRLAPWRAETDRRPHPPPLSRRGRVRGPATLGRVRGRVGAAREAGGRGGAAVRPRAGRGRPAAGG
ncbi:hypothetical protein KVF89_28005 [Nocardioides carbamazepini]|uniref:hypothetical protein n=1 Tax=Nocardioides carbamazepini TaxID=2854259 RepID=UPI00214A16B7|nr:hypothetical protein [Nocardioides carbamazepini]MCR1786410.1 hypothetical protein [Nocardioides carbamazepini]